MSADLLVRPRVFLDVQSGADFFGRIVIELFIDKAPKTCENFRSICTLSHTSPPAAGPLTYKGSPFHRIIDSFMIQGGDITAGNGTGGTSIYGGNLADENLGWRDIDAPGLVCMANRGKDTNSSQFFITLAPCEHLNAKHTVYGHVVKGMDVCERMAKVPVDSKDRPLSEIIVSHCGELERRLKPTAVPTEPMSRQTQEHQRSHERSNGRIRRHSSSDSSTRLSNRSRSGSRRRKYRKVSQSPRRRSDVGLDENRRGRTPTRLVSPGRVPSEPSPQHRRHRKRNSPPSRPQSPKRSRSPHLRRRSTDRNRSPRYDGRSGWHDQHVENRYGHTRRDERQERRRNESDPDHAGRPGDRFYGNRERNRSRHYDDSRLEGGHDNDEPEIKFKGRGSMKYRERKW